MQNSEITSLFDMARSALPGRDRCERVAVLGLGNILLSDEGVGVHAVNALNTRFTFSPSIEIIDGGTMGLDLLPLFQERDRILIIDAVDFGKAPGYVRIVRGDEIRGVLNMKLSVHHVGLADLLYAAKLTRSEPPEVCLVGIQPESLAVALEMTYPVRSKFETVLEMALQKLKEWNIVHAARSTPRYELFRSSHAGK